MSVDVSTDIVINRPPEIVAHYASDPDHVPDMKNGVFVLPLASTIATADV